MSIKSGILEALESNRDSYVSGQALAEKLGVSRNAVWKGIEALRREGHEIASSTNAGYRLMQESDILSAEGIRACLSESRRCMEIVCLNETDSTNAEAKRRYAESGCGAALVAANCQTAGRGRLGRSFYSPADTGIYMTLAIRKSVKVEDSVGVTCAAAVAVARATERLCGKKTGIKWVNDVYLEGKKICGILTEGIIDLNAGSIALLVIGIGINVSTQSFPKELVNAASIGARGLLRNALAAAVTDELLDILEGRSEWLADYRARSIVTGKKITYIRGSECRQAEAVSIEPDGGLRVINEDGREEVLRSGEISLRVMDNA